VISGFIFVTLTSALLSSSNRDSENALRPLFVALYRAENFELLMASIEEILIICPLLFFKSLKSRFVRAIGAFRLISISLSICAIDSSSCGLNIPTPAELTKISICSFFLKAFIVCSSSLYIP